jgi:hypothetical protein
MEYLAESRRFTDWLLDAPSSPQGSVPAPSTGSAQPKVSLAPPSPAASTLPTRTLPLEERLAPLPLQLRAAAGRWRVSLPRLCDALRQLVRGLCELHSELVIHCDVTPSNVVVMPDGRVVVLDFGLAKQNTRWSDDDARGARGGTLSYMSPEQQSGHPPTPASDWYSVGVMLYEVATGGVRPFAGQTWAASLMLKDRALRPSELAEGVPPDLDDLIYGLLEPDPARRLGADEILAWLKRRDPAGEPANTVSLVGVRVQAALQGRDQELDQLHRAFHRVAPEQPVIVHISAPSGQGKTALVQTFMRQLHSAAGPQVLVFHSRCHPEDQIHYRAMDGIIDALADHLARHHDLARECSYGLAHAAPLLGIFPTLARVPSLLHASEASSAAPPPATDYERRRRAFGALREVLRRVARHKRLVLWIDDLQWGDLDSVHLLQEVLGPSGPPGLMLLLGYRDELMDENPVLVAMRREAPWDHAAELKLSLRPLDEAASRAFLASLLRDPHIAPPPAQVEAIIHEAQGNPFLLGELAAHLTMDPATATPSMRQIVEERVRDLDESAVEALELLAASGQPLGFALLEKALGGQAALWNALRPLQRRSLLSLQQAPEAQLEIYHHRMREAVLEQMQPSTRLRRHASLARALRQAASPDAQRLLYHLENSDQRAEAARYALTAGEEAAQVLAFGQAAEFYRRALELGQDQLPLYELHERLAHALANHGVGAQASAHFTKAADALAQVEGPRDRTLELRRLSAHHAIRSGDLDGGTAQLLSLLRAVGVEPPSQGATLRWVAKRGAQEVEHLLSDWFPRGLSPLPQGALSAQERLRLDVLWTATTSLSLHDYALSDFFGVLHLQRARQSGNPSKQARALAFEAHFQACAGGPKRRARAARLLALVDGLAAQTQDPYDRAWHTLATGTSSYMGGQWLRAREACDEAIEAFRDQIGTSWEIVTAEAFSLASMAHLGELHALRERLPAALQDARRRGDLFAEITFTLGAPTLVWLLDEGPQAVLERADVAIARRHSDPFLIDHYAHLLACAQAELYRRDGWAVWARVEAAWPKLSSLRSLLLKLENIAVELYHLRGRAALAALRDPAPPPAGTKTSRAALVACVKDARAQIASVPVPWAKPLDHALGAGLALERGERAAAIDHLEGAAQGFDAAHMSLYAHAARACVGGLRQDLAGEALRQKSREELRRLGVNDVDALVSTLLPGCLAP